MSEIRADYAGEQTAAWQNSALDARLMLDDRLGPLDAQVTPLIEATYHAAAAGDFDAAAAILHNRLYLGARAQLTSVLGRYEAALDLLRQFYPMRDVTLDPHTADPHSSLTSLPMRPCTDPTPLRSRDRRPDMTESRHERAPCPREIEMADHADVNALPLEHQYVLYAAATHSSLLDLLTHWQPWLPELEWSDIAVHVPALAEAIAVLVARGQIELFFGEPGGEVGLVSSADVPGIVMDTRSWWSPVDGATPETALIITPDAGLVQVPQRRPEATLGQ